MNNLLVTLAHLFYVDKQCHFLETFFAQNLHTYFFEPIKIKTQAIIVCRVIDLPIGKSDGEDILV